MADLVLNFAPAPDTSSGGVYKKVKTGRWSERARLNSKNARNSKDSKETVSPIKNSSYPASNANATSGRRRDSESSSKKPRIESNEHDSANANAASSHSQPASNNSRHLVISSLFSSLPQYESSSSSAKPLRTLAPTNAPSDLSFSSLNLDPKLLEHLTSSPKLNLRTLTSIQTVAIPNLTQPSSFSDTSRIPSDVILQAETGSGKTLSYLLPIINDLIRISVEKSWTRQVGTLAVILVPTKELAAQVLQVCQDLLSFRGDHRWCVPGMLTGGTTRTHEKARLRNGLPILISTPGRLIDHLQTTSCFRIAGDPVRATNASSSTQSQQLPTVENADEFDIEDHPFEAGRNADTDSDDSTDYERLESMPASQSHRSNRLKSNRSTSNVNNVDPELTLRWLVLDEADRLMDMGFEPQISSILNLLASRSRIAAKAQRKHETLISKRRTILCSATVDSKVQSLAGIALNNPLVIKPPLKQTNKSISNSDDSSNDQDSFKAPAQLKQAYIITPAKLRFIALVSILRQALKQDSDVARKVVIFASCTDAVDLLWEAFGGLDLRRDPVETTSGAREKKDTSSKNNNNSKLCKKCMLFPNSQFYRLHGNMDFQSRMASLTGFSETQNSSHKKRKRREGNDENKEENDDDQHKQEVSDKILICTSVAARGLDIPQVGTVVQYDLPTEGGSKEYLHRVGRTARAGRKGQSWAIVLPEEKDWVDWVSKSSSNDNDGENDNQKSVTGGILSKLYSVSLDDTLRDGLGGDGKRDWETRATDVQMAFERWVHLADKNTLLARNAFKSHVRAYATHPSAEKFIFHIKNLHLGHLAKSFGLREAPGGGGNYKASKNNSTSSNKKKTTSSNSKSSKDLQKGTSSGNINRAGRKLEKSGGSEFNVASLDMLEKLVKGG